MASNAKAVKKGPPKTPYKSKAKAVLITLEKAINVVIQEYGIDPKSEKAIRNALVRLSKVVRQFHGIKALLPIETRVEYGDNILDVYEGALAILQKINPKITSVERAMSRTIALVDPPTTRSGSKSAGDGGGENEEPEEELMSDREEQVREEQEEADAISAIRLAGAKGTTLSSDEGSDDSSEGYHTAAPKKTDDEASKKKGDDKDKKKKKGKKDNAIEGLDKVFKVIAARNAARIEKANRKRDLAKKLSKSSCTSSSNGGEDPAVTDARERLSRWDFRQMPLHEKSKPKKDKRSVQLYRRQRQWVASRRTD